MSDIRKFFKTVPTSTKSRTQVTAASQKSSEKAPVRKAVSSIKPKTAKTVPEQNMSTKDTDPATKKKRQENFRSFMNRGGPTAPGSKEIPDGEKNCLKNLTFVISGVLESLERDECKSLIERYAGRVTSVISGKTNYLIIGREASEGKTSKAREMNIKILSEDDLLEMIRTRSGEQDSAEAREPPKTVKKKSSTVSKSVELDPTELSKTVSALDDSTLLWVDKYKPQTIKALIGQQGEKSCTQKLIIWLRDWYKHHGQSEEHVKAKSSFTTNAPENPAMFKAALLSGPPGIGKTTCAQLVCQHLNFEYIERNASDQRSKKSMANLVSDTYSIVNISNKSSVMSKHVLIMDEVDGVAGNQDRGGIQELISLIKRTRIPIICICNDRQHTKIRSLANYCYDLRFSRPTVQQIRAAMLTILHRENIQNTEQDVLDEIIKSCNQDIRQTIHTLNLWANQGGTNKTAARMIEKSSNANPFELCRLSFSDELREKSLSDKSDIFFYDYQLMPLLVQENYLQCQPHLSTSNKQRQTLTDIEHFQLISKAADSISLGDLCSQMIFSRNESWSLLPFQAIFSTVAPCSYVRGRLRSMVNFSSYFGQRSRANKNERLLKEIEKHMCLKVSSISKQQFNLDYLPYLTRAFMSPLKALPQEQGVEKCISILDDYYLNRDDLQTIVELNTWGKTTRNLYEQLNTQTKSLLTRNYNKTTHLTPYAIVDMKKLKRSRASSDEEDEDEQPQQQEEMSTEEIKIDDDAMVKPVKARAIHHPMKKARK